jgi:hypothetical protein
MNLAKKLHDHFKGDYTDWRSEAFGGVVVAMVALFFASLLIKIAVLPIIVYIVNLLFVVGIGSAVYGSYAAWRMGQIA